MKNLDIHKNIHNKLNHFLKTKKVPNILFYGPSGSGKRTILNNFLDDVYKNIENYNDYILSVNCSHGKGIKFIRDELIFFGKININIKQGEVFKSIILYNAENLTNDAQSALRRCIEMFSHTTRFFIIVENKDKILKPILSRFCEIYVNYPQISNKYVNLHKYIIKKHYSIKSDNKTFNWIDKNVNFGETNENYYLLKSNEAYENGISAIDIINYIDMKKECNELLKYKMLMYFDKIKTQFRNEKNIIFFIFIYGFMRHNHTLENVMSI